MWKVGRLYIIMPWFVYILRCLDLSYYVGDSEFPTFKFLSSQLFQNRSSCAAIARLFLTTMGRHPPGNRDRYSVLVKR